MLQLISLFWRERWLKKKFLSTFRLYKDLTAVWPLWGWLSLTSYLHGWLKCFFLLLLSLQQMHILKYIVILSSSSHLLVFYTMTSLLSLQVYLVFFIYFPYLFLYYYTFSLRLYIFFSIFTVWILLWRLFGLLISYVCISLCVYVSFDMCLPLFSSSVDWLDWCISLIINPFSSSLS